MSLHTRARRRSSATACLLLAGSVLLTGCQTGSSTHQPEELAPGDDAPIFSSSVFGVAASPRMVRTKKVPKGGGRDQVGKPYMVRGKWYYPKEEPGYVKTGKASWYGANFHGRLTANGEIYDMYHLSAAHPTFPLPSYARVTNRKNGASVLVRVNDRGPYMHERVLDVSQKAAELLDFRHDGIGDVKVEYVGRAPVEGDDTKMLMASYHRGNARPVDAGLPSGVMVASASPSVSSRIASLFGRRATPAAEEAPATLMAMNPAPATRARPPAPRPVPTTAPAPAAASALSVEDLIQTYDGSVAENVPLPGARSVALGYAPAASSASSQAFRHLLAPVPASGETIEIGAIEDMDAFVRVADLLASYASATEEGSDGQTVTLRPGQDADGLLRRLWSAGATDAFVIRD